MRAADSQSNNLVEADAASSEEDFLYKMRVSLREAKESKECLIKIGEGRLAACEGCHSKDSRGRPVGRGRGRYAVGRSSTPAGVIAR